MSLATKTKRGSPEITHFRVGDRELIQKFKERAIELDRFLSDCWGEAINSWLKKSTYDRSKKTKQESIHFGIRVDTSLIKKLRVAAVKQKRTQGECLEEATRDWLRKQSKGEQS
jgi:hypothetical protein